MIGPGFPEKIYHHALIVILKEEMVDFETEKEFNMVLIISEIVLT